MLDACAPGWKWKETDHSFRIVWNGKTYPSFPKHKMIDVGHIKKMARHFGILEKAKNHLPVL